MRMQAHPAQQIRQRTGTVLVILLSALVHVPVNGGTVSVACTVMVVVMAAGSGQRITHASQHASDSALQHINT